MKDLLVAVSHHDATDRREYLRRVLKTFAEYPLSVDLIVDTQVTDLHVLGDNVTVVSHPNLAHPFELCWKHRVHFRDQIENYATFFYIENDMVLPYENFLAYQRNFEQLWPAGYVPGFVRVEQHEGEEYAVDQVERQAWNEKVPGFCALNPGYHGFWILPRQVLKDAMATTNFVRLSDSREAAASFPLADLGRTALVQVEGKHVARTSLAYHVSNKYAPCPTSGNGKIKLGELFL